MEGAPCFGRIGGGYGFSGANHLEIPHALELEPEQPTPELWPFVVLERMRSPLIRAEGDRADFSLEGGLRHVPVTVAELSRPGAAILETRTAEAWTRAPGAEVRETDHDAGSGTWAHTFSVRADTPEDARTRRQFRFRLQD